MTAEREERGEQNTKGVAIRQKERSFFTSLTHPLAVLSRRARINLCLLLTCFDVFRLAFYVGHTIPESLSRSEEIQVTFPPIPEAALVL